MHLIAYYFNSVLLMTSLEHHSLLMTYMQQTLKSAVVQSLLVRLTPVSLEGF